jgi:hypothetical protein
MVHRDVDGFMNNIKNFVRLDIAIGTTLLIDIKEMALGTRTSFL